MLPGGFFRKVAHGLEELRLSGSQGAEGRFLNLPLAVVGLSGVAAEGRDEVRCRPRVMGRGRSFRCAQSVATKRIRGDWKVVSDFQGVMPGSHLQKPFQPVQRLFFTGLAAAGMQPGTPGIPQGPREADRVPRPGQCETPKYPQGRQEGQWVSAVQPWQKQAVAQAVPVRSCSLH